MGQFIQKLMGGGSNKAAAQANAQRAAEAQQARAVQEASQAQTLQAQGQQAAQTDQGLAAARKQNRGRRLLIDTGGAAGVPSKTSIG